MPPVKSKSNPQKNENISKVKNPVVSNGKVTYTCIYFGHYPQSDVTGKKMDNIKWRVPSVKGNDAFLVADQNLDVMPYNETMRKVTWETCTMRSWLNGYGSNANVCGIDYRNENFIDKAFSEKEQAAIYTTNVVNKDDPELGTEGGRDTKNEIFLLSVDEVSNSVYGFLPYKDSDTNCIEDAARLRTNTAYVNNGGTVRSEWMKENGPFFVEKDGGYWWWLRSPGSNEYYGVDNASVNSCGSILKYGLVPTKYAVCPALHLNLSSSTVWSMADSVMVTR